MVRCMMNLIIAVGGSMKWMMTLNLCMMLLKKILDINYTYESVPSQDGLFALILWYVEKTLY